MKSQLQWSDRMYTLRIIVACITQYVATSLWVQRFACGNGLGETSKHLKFE